MSLYTSIHTEYTTLVMNPNVNSELRVLKTHQKKYTTLLEDVDNGGRNACDGVGDKWEISVPSLQFCCELTALKNKSLKIQVVEC